MERMKNVAEIQRRMMKRKAFASANHALRRFLLSKGIAYSITEEIILEFSMEDKELSGLKKSLVKRIHTIEERVFPRQLALVGPTGVGKTTTLLKLADFYRKKGKKIAIVALDLEKGGALAQLERYAKTWDIPIHASVETVAADLTLIDTSGCNFYLPNRVDQLGEQLSACGDVEILLTLSAPTKEVDLYGAIHQFSPLRPWGLVFTKLDETLSSGVLINISAKTDFPIAYISYGYPLPGEIEVADPYQITHKILTDLNEKEFNHLRHLTLADGFK